MSSIFWARPAVLASLVALHGCSEQQVGQMPAEASIPAPGSGGAAASGGSGAGGTTAPASSGGGGALTAGGASGNGGGGGTSSGGTSSGGASSGGASSGGASSGGASSGGAPETQAGGCTGMPLCASFEDQPVGSNPAGFAIVDPETGGAADSATIDGIGARGSSRSLKVVSHGRIWARFTGAAPSLGPSLHVHFFVRFDAPLPASHVSFVSMNVSAPRDAYDENQELRFGGQEGVFHWNNALNDRNVPSVSPAGNAASVKPAAQTWYCVTLSVDEATGRFSAIVDGTSVPALTQDGAPTPDIDAEWLGDPRLATWTSSIVDVSFGFRSYGGGGATVWFDEIAVGDTPVACP